MANDQPRVFPRDLPMNAVWTTLRRKWMARMDGRTNNDLCDHLNRMADQRYTPQSVSQWATGSDGRNPPWLAVFLLLAEMGLDLVIRSDGTVSIRPNGRVPSPDSTKE